MERPLEGRDRAYWLKNLYSLSSSESAQNARDVLRRLLDVKSSLECSKIGCGMCDATPAAASAA